MKSQTLNLYPLEVLRSAKTWDTVMSKNHLIGTRLWIFFTIACMAPVSISAQEKADHITEGTGTVWIEHAEIVLSPSPAGMAAGYLTVFNDTDEEVAITSVATPSFGDVSLHRTETEDGIVRMRPVGDPVRIPQSTEFVMKPGGFHLMLMQPVSEVVPGKYLNLEVGFADGSTLAVNAEVLAFGQRPADHHHGEDDAAMR